MDSMRKWRNISAVAGLILSFLLLSSCGKEWLDAKPDKSQVVPKSIKDFQVLLDNSALFNIN
uniref:hypothetical protein n=1 Tax=Pedobacter schmidteae TaxID=2201271 RepID=UPI0013CF05A5|nr:hypothetical protein [Pedobacter schmidteae]